jgi:hypothetical protein
MLRAICIRCGAAKKTAMSACRECGFNPEGDISSSARSLYLSLGKSGKDDPGRMTEDTLTTAQSVIKSGGAVEFDPVELQRIEDAMKEFAKIRTVDVWRAVFRLFLPGVAILAVLLVLLLLLRNW